MNKTKWRPGLGDFLLLALSALFLLGLNTFIDGCGPRADDGGWMTCHWADQAMTGIAAVLLVISVLHLLVRSRKTKAGLDFAIIPLAALAGVIPGHLIDTCMMENMCCNAIMKPGAILFAALIIAAAVIDLVIGRGQA